MKGSGEEGEEDDTAESRVYVCVTSAVEENCLTAITRLLNDNLLSQVSGLSLLPFLSFSGKRPLCFLAIQATCNS